jgi:5-methyltetrahydrofolate--homocysteine methyltransferase
MFVANPLWAFPWNMAMAGCPIKRDADNLWALPALDDWKQLDRLRFDPNNRWFRRQLEFTQALVGHAVGRYPVGAGQLMLGPVDMMMQLRGQERLALDFYDSPEMVLALGQKCVDLCAAAVHALYAVVPTHLGGRAGTIRCFWAPGEFVETAEDISFMLSPALHRRFAAPLHQALGQRFPYTMVHLHSAQLHTVPTLLDVDQIAAIEITPDFGEDLVPKIPILARILERKPLLIHGVLTVATGREIMRALPTRGLALLLRCDTPAEAAKVLDSLL